MRITKISILVAVLALLAAFPTFCPAADPINNAGTTAFKKGDLDTALAMYSVAVDLRPDDFQGYVNRGVVFLAKGQYDFAVLDFSQAISLNPACSEAFTNRASAHIAQNRPQRAYDDASRAILLNENNAEAYYTRAVAGYLSKTMDKVWLDLMNSQRLGFAPATSMLAAYRNLPQQW